MHLALRAGAVYGCRVISRWRITDNWWDAEDALQEALAYVLESWPRFDPSEYHAARWGALKTETGLGNWLDYIQALKRGGDGRQPWDVDPEAVYDLAEERGYATPRTIRNKDGSRRKTAMFTARETAEQYRKWSQSWQARDLCATMDADDAPNLTGEHYE